MAKRSKNPLVDQLLAVALSKSKGTTDPAAYMKQMYEAMAKEGLMDRKTFEIVLRKSGLPEKFKRQLRSIAKFSAAKEGGELAKFVPSRVIGEAEVGGKVRVPIVPPPPGPKKGLPLDLGKRLPGPNKIPAYVREVNPFGEGIPGGPAILGGETAASVLPEVAAAEKGKAAGGLLGGAFAKFKKLSSLGKVAGVGIGGELLITVLANVLKSMYPEPPPVKTAEERMGEMEMAKNAQVAMYKNDPGLYTAMLQFLSGQAPVTGLSPDEVRFGPTPKTVKNDVMQQALLQLLSEGG